MILEMSSQQNGIKDMLQTKKSDTLGDSTEVSSVSNVFLFDLDRMIVVSQELIHSIHSVAWYLKNILLTNISF